VVVERLTEGRTGEAQLDVLVVEGDAAACERLRAALGHGYALRFVTGADQALENIRERRPDLLVSEVDLLDGDGLRLCEQVRALPEATQLPILLLTNRASIQDKVAGFQAGADDYVVKPLDMRLFPARLRLLCRIKRIERPRPSIA
jgi:DNA-binding response OmpR family regulator